MDWEARPDIVAQYFGEVNQSQKTQFIVRRFDYDNNFTEEIYDYETIPSKVMKEFPLIFTKEEINQKMMLEWLNKE